MHKYFWNPKICANICTNKSQQIIMPQMFSQFLVQIFALYKYFRKKLCKKRRKFSMDPICIVTLFLLTSVHIAHFRIGILNIAVVMLYVFWIEIPGVSFDRFHSLRHFLSNLAQPLFGTTSLDTQWNRVFVWSKFCICITYFLNFL